MSKDVAEKAYEQSKEDTTAKHGMSQEEVDTAFIRSGMIEPGSEGGSTK